MWVSTDAGINFTLAAGGYDQNHYSQQDNFQDVMYRWTTSLLEISIDAGATWTTLWTGGVGLHYLTTGGGSLTPLEYMLHPIYPGDGAKATTIRFIASAGNDGSGIRYLHKSDDSGATWAATAFPSTCTNTGETTSRVRGLSVVHDASDMLYFIGEGVFVSEDEGATIYARSGVQRDPFFDDATSIATDAGSVIRILQVWDV